jgi:ABC-type molybdate transport system permease subunit
MPYKGERPSLMRMVISLPNEIFNYLTASPFTYAFTEHGAVMAANVINSPLAIQMSVFVVRAFIKIERNGINSSGAVPPPGRIGEIYRQ